MERGISEGEGSGIPQGKVIDFPLGVPSSSQERWLLWSQVYPGPENPTMLSPRLSPVAPNPEPPHKAPVRATLPSLGPKVGSLTHKTCALPLEEK